MLFLIVYHLKNVKINTSFIYNRYPITHTIYANNCDEKFLFYWLTNRYVFSKMINLYLNSYPCNYESFKLWYKMNIKVYIQKDIYN